MSKSGYTIDLTIRQRNFIFANFPEIFHTKSKADIFEILNALFYPARTGCRWRLLPHDLPKWRTVYGFPLTMAVSRANVHDSKGAIGLAIDITCKYPTIRLLKADYGYRGPLVGCLKEGLSMNPECVKSNFGTSEFKPIDGRQVVERTFSWLESFRRLNRNYEQFLHTAKGIAMVACAMFMLRSV